MYNIKQKEGGNMKVNAYNGYSQTSFNGLGASTKKVFTRIGARCSNAAKLATEATQARADRVHDNLPANKILKGLKVFGRKCMVIAAKICRTIGNLFKKMPAATV